MKLFICEKPSQAKDIAGVLGAGTRMEHCFEGPNLLVTWCIGHLLEQAPPDHYCANVKPWRMAVLPIVPEVWKMFPVDKTKKQLEAIGKLLKKAKTVVIATDADREGDVIGREVLDYFGFKGSVERLWLSALDEASIKKALADIRPGSSTEPLYQAGLGRQRADWLLGMNLTMAVSSLYGAEGVLSVGRVQTPTLKLVVDRDLSIENFKSRDHYALKVQWDTAHQECFWTTWEIPEEMADEEGRCLDKSVVIRVGQSLENCKGIIKEFKEQHKKTAAPLCLSLSELQKMASSRFGFSAKETLEGAQALYEKHKATTYPRTDCGYLPESQFADASRVLEALLLADSGLGVLIAKCNPLFKSRAWNDKKVTAHHGIIPTTNPRVDLKAMTAKERKLYELVRDHYLAQFLGDYEYQQRQVLVEAEGHRFKRSSQMPLVSGWKEALTGLEDREEDADDEEENEDTIPSLSNGEPVSLLALRTYPKRTRPAARFTEGSLIAAMKSVAAYVSDVSLKKILKDTSGIGTEATRANILETLVHRDYLKRHGKQLISTAKGRELIALLPDSITNPATTALWEQILDGIASGQSAQSDFLDDQRDALEGMLEQLASQKKDRFSSAGTEAHPCPACQKPMQRRKGKKGYWWGCTGYPECRTTFPDDGGKPKEVKPVT
jgi:DNA topoisomerase-3